MRQQRYFKENKHFEHCFLFPKERKYYDNEDLTGLALYLQPVAHRVSSMADYMAATKGRSIHVNQWIERVRFSFKRLEP